MRSSPRHPTERAPWPRSWASWRELARQGQRPTRRSDAANNSEVRRLSGIFLSGKMAPVAARLGPVASRGGKMARPRAKRQRRRICPLAGKRDACRLAGDAPEARAKGRLSGHHSRPATSPGRTGGLAAVDPSAESWRSERQVRARLCENADRRIFRARTEHLAAHSRRVEHAAFAQLGRLGILLRDILASTETSPEHPAQKRTR